MADASILVGDVGGTSVRFALAMAQGTRVSVSAPWKRAGDDFASLEAALHAFLAETRAQPTGAALGLAGIVAGDHVVLPNRGWDVDLAAVRRALGGAPVAAVNDFFAMARAVPELAPMQVDLLRPGEADPRASIAVGGPGTGFGLAILRSTPDGYVVVAGEGGHCTYAPQTQQEWEVMRAMHHRGQTDVSNELVASGAGFELTRDALAEVMGLPPQPLTPADVIRAAEAGEAFAVAFCRLRAATVMTAMGNLALICNASGGVYIAGGVGMRLAPWLREPAAVARFQARGPRTQFLSAIPIRLVKDESAPLLGAAHLWLDQQRRGWL